MRQQNEPITDEDRAKWPGGEQPLNSGIYSGFYGQLGYQQLTPEQIAFQESMQRKYGTVPRPATMDAVLVEIIDGKPIVSVMARDERQRPELEALARQIIRSGIGEAE